MGLVTRVVPHGQSRQAAEALAHELAALPQTCLRHDRLSAYEQWGHPTADALSIEFKHGQASLPEVAASARRFLERPEQGG